MIMGSTQTRQQQATTYTIMLLSCVAAFYLLLYYREHAWRLSLAEQLRSLEQTTTAPALVLHRQPGLLLANSIDGQQQAKAGYELAAPWTAPRGTLLPYQGLHDNLEELLKVQASPGGWVSLITMTAAIQVRGSASSAVSAQAGSANS